MKKYNQREDVLTEIEEGFNFIEKVKVRLNKKLTFKIYKKGVQKGFNWCMNSRKNVIR